MRLARALDAILSGLERPRVLVVSDRYPPRSYGGAEVSLHILLRSLGQGRELLVVTFDDAALTPSLVEVDGVRVLELPRQGPWPHHKALRASTLGSIGGPGTSTSAFSGTPPTTTTPTNSELLARVLAARPQGGVLADIVEYPEGAGRTMLAQVLRRLEPGLIHADNHRSILMVAASARGLPLRRVGVVRDNRFHCARHDQSLRVGEQRCRSCDLACAPVDLPAAPDLQRHLLERVGQHRRHALSAMDHVIVTSRYLEGAVTAFIDAERVTRIPNAVDDVAEAERAMAGVAELPGTNLLLVGMINENKGQLALVRCLEGLVSRVPDAVLHVAGRGARIEKRLRDLAQEKGLQQRLVFHGHLDRERLYRLYRECQIVAVPALWPEPFGRVPLEAGMACRPVVSFATGGLSESILHGVTGSLVEPGDMAGFLGAIAELADAPRLRRSMGHAARRHVLATYSVESAREKLLETWRVIEERAGHP